MQRWVSLTVPPTNERKLNNNILTSISFPILQVFKILGNQKEKEWQKWAYNFLSHWLLTFELYYTGNVFVLWNA